MTGKLVPAHRAGPVDVRVLGQEQDDLKGYSYPVAPATCGVVKETGGAGGVSHCVHLLQCEAGHFPTRQSKFA